jgi:hypothetical protein
MAARVVRAEPSRVWAPRVARAVLMDKMGSMAAPPLPVKTPAELAEVEAGPGELRVGLGATRPPPPEAPEARLETETMEGLTRAAPPKQAVVPAAAAVAVVSTEERAPGRLLLSPR